MQKSMLTRLRGGVIVTPDFLDTLGLNNNTSLVGTVTALYGKTPMGLLRSETLIIPETLAAFLVRLPLSLSVTC